MKITISDFLYSLCLFQCAMAFGYFAAEVSFDAGYPGALVLVAFLSLFVFGLGFTAYFAQRLISRSNLRRIHALENAHGQPESQAISWEQWRETIQL